MSMSPKRRKEGMQLGNKTIEQHKRNDKLNSSKKTKLDSF